VADTQILAGGVKTAPLAYVVPGLQEIIVKAGFATFDGTGAAGSFLPCFRLLSPANKVVGEYITDTAVAAGASAEVSWFPGLSGSAAADVNPVISNELDYVEVTAPVTILPANTFSNQVNIVSSHPLSFDGSTRIRVEVFTPTFDNDHSNNFILELWDNTTDLGRLGQLNTDPTPNDIGVPLYLVRYLTPTTGTHTFSMKGWTATAAGFETFTAGTGGLGGGGNPNYLPGWMRIST
jgi:hypothetical protein